jgi:hypothetical protein
MMTGAEKPIGVAIIICDKVITEQGTGNKTIVSIFNTIGSPSFPCLHHKMSIYVAMTNATGIKQVNLILKFGDDEKIKVGGKINFPAPDAVVEVIFNLVGVPFAEPGLYCFEAHVSGEYVFESRFNVTKSEE